MNVDCFDFTWLAIYVIVVGRRRAASARRPSRPAPASGAKSVAMFAELKSHRQTRRSVEFTTDLPTLTRHYWPE
jgi:hypothetical protein